MGERHSWVQNYVSFSESWSAVAAALFPTFYTYAVITSAAGHTQAPVLSTGCVSWNKRIRLNE